ETATPTGLDLAADQSQPLARVQSQFINAQLGFGPSALGGGATTESVEKHFACVNGHQTDDPLSPPCDTAVASNAGATYQGVTSEEIRIAVVAFGNNEFACGLADDPCSRPVMPTPSESWVDLDKAPNNLMFARAMRDYVTYFNQRFQTYGRRV